MCPLCQAPKALVVKSGFFKRATGKRVQRYRCRSCRRGFSVRTLRWDYRDGRSSVNDRLELLLASGVSQRRCALLLAIDRSSVARKLVRLSRRARSVHEKALLTRSPKSTVVFDEMETFEHTKCKPLSIAVAVEEGSRWMIAGEVAQMPAKGRIAAISRRKYGPRADHRPQALARMGKKIRTTQPKVQNLK